MSGFVVVFIKAVDQKKVFKTRVKTGFFWGWGAPFSHTSYKKLI